MRSFLVSLILLLGSGLVACNRDRPRQDGAAARQAGRDAYRATEQAKRDAKQAAHEVERTGKDFQQGWNEAKHHDQKREK